MPGKPNPKRGRLLETWAEAFGSPPPPYLSVGFMEAALSYEAQRRKHGGLPAKTRKALRQIAEDQPVAELTRSTPKPGAHLVREWNGRTYQVEVLAEGFRMDGREWRSLSAIARHITGTSWSGPRFFGLTRKEGERR